MDQPNVYDNKRILNEIHFNSLKSNNHDISQINSDDNNKLVPNNNSNNNKSNVIVSTSQQNEQKLFPISVPEISTKSSHWIASSHKFKLSETSMRSVRSGEYLLYYMYVI